MVEPPQALHISGSQFRAEVRPQVQRGPKGTSQSNTQTHRGDLADVVYADDIIARYI